MSEAVRQAITKALSEAGTTVRMPAAAVPPAPAAPTAEQWRSMDDNDLAEYVGSAMAARAAEAFPRAVGKALSVLVAEALRTGVLTESQAATVLRERGVVAEDNATDGEELRRMSDDDLMSHIGGAYIAYGEAELASALIGGTRAVPSPFTRGL